MKRHMRAWIFSDLHVDANAATPWVLPDPRPDHDVVVIAGDIRRGLRRGVDWIAAHKLNAKPVIYVPGNHEYYGFDFETERAAGRAAAATQPNIHVLDRDIAVIDGIAFLGATLWTDYRLFGAGSAQVAMLRAEQAMNDHRLIQRAGGRWSAADAAAEHDQSRTWLEFQLAAQSKPSVVITHTAPSLKSIAARYRDDLVTAAFASELEHLADHTTLWVHGHTHVGCDYRLGACRVVNNPRGYVGAGESEGFNGTFVCEL